ncbi:MAG: insulinase family protein [Planctomycetes bacterium]|nr:insulinase family protein [Planctomycetota bacterium]
MPAPESAASGSTGPLSPGKALSTFLLPNGMTVVLLEDHALPKVVIDTWFAVGSKDEASGRSGFAHLFEHLMFMGTARVPGNQFDVLMERGGGSNNASTSADRTNYFSMGPSSLLPTLLWLDAERLDALDDNMNQEKLDRQRDIVRNERRQNTENVPYGKVELLLPEALYPSTHPYHHPVIGSHADLEAAKVEDVVGFFREFYVPANATLVVAGDFDPAEVRPLIERTFGALPSRPLPQHAAAEPVALKDEVRVVDSDQVEFQKLYLAWHSPAQYARGDAELDLLATILAEGPASRLEQRLVLDTRLAQEVDASQQSGELGSVFQIEALAAPGADLEQIKQEILATLDDLQKNGPNAAELERARTRQEARFLRRMESLLARAEALQAYRRFFGVSDGFQRDLERWTHASREDVRDVARAVFGPGRVDLRILPALDVDAAALDQRPNDFPRRSFQPAVPTSFTLANGIPVHFLARPGTGLFSGSLLVAGGESALPAERAGSALLAARWIESGAGGRDKTQFAALVEALGGALGASAARNELGYDVSGLASRLPQTLDLLRDMVLAPNLAETDFAREKTQLLNDIAARDDDPNAVARTVSRALLFGGDDPRGRPLEGTAASVGALERQRVAADVGLLLDPARAAFVFAGDLDRAALQSALEARFGAWETQSKALPAAPAPLTALGPQLTNRIVFVHREHAPQTVIQILRPVPGAEGLARAVRGAVDTAFGGTFTSRLNANLREDKGWTYGARSRVSQEGAQYQLGAGAAVVTAHTGESLREFRQEFARLHAEGLDAAELEKAVESSRTRLVETNETTAGLARSLSELVRNGRALDALASDMTALDQIDLAKANALAKSGLYDWDACLVVLVGEREAITQQLAAAGFPAPLEVDSLGAPKP